ncbi:MAG: hypothetical protein HQL31_03975 [Planctomycetes bacterium]|nr:hypothetical protein [Planctomycetota bacterium]
MVDFREIVKKSISAGDLLPKPRLLRKDREAPPREKPVEAREGEGLRGIFGDPIPEKKEQMQAAFDDHLGELFGIERPVDGEDHE